jgi:hypothetical protein
MPQNEPQTWGGEIFHIIRAFVGDVLRDAGYGKHGGKGCPEVVHHMHIHEINFLTV